MSFCRSDRDSSFFEDEFHKNFGEWLTLVEGCLALTKALRLLERPSHLTQNTARPERCSAKDNKKTSQKTTMGDKVLRHFVILEYLRQISFLISTILPLSPFSMLDFLSAEFASFLYNSEKGDGGWFSL